MLPEAKSTGYVFKAQIMRTKNVIIKTCQFFLSTRKDIQNA